MLLQSMGHFKGWFTTDGVNIDDLPFKMHYGLTSVIILFSSLLVTGKVYLGEPIYCSMGSSDFAKIVPKEMLNSYCYIHSTFLIPDTTSGEYTYPGVGPHHPEEKESKAIYQSYYQWVPLVLFLQGLCFFVPRMCWSQLEHGTMKKLRKNLHEPALDGEEKKLALEKLLGYIKKHVGRHKRYGRNFILCIIGNLVNLVAQITITNFFLGGKFVGYGFNYSYGSSMEQTATEDIMFPKMAKCHLHLYGPSGTKQLMDNLCVLPLNLLHEKVFLVLWYWYFLLLIVTVLNIGYWLIHCFHKSFRLKHLQRHLKPQIDDARRLKPFNGNFGDWFVLHQLYRNLQHSNFRQLVEDMCKAEESELGLWHLRQRLVEPKEQLSNC